MYEHTIFETLFNETRGKTNISQIDRGGGELADMDKD